MKRIAIFASGAGSNALAIINHFRGHQDIIVGLVVCNKPAAGVLNIAAAAGLPVIMIEKERFFRGNGYLDELVAAGISHIVLAGFLWKIPNTLVQAYAGRIINIHPALLPKYGGKGMYGALVHEAVIRNRETESGITIHEVDDIYDHGQPIFQEIVPVTPTDTPASLAAKIHALEHAHYPRIIEAWVNQPRKG
jgi:phosphoribosylglycinamide formyltransferase 1